MAAFDDKTQVCVKIMHVLPAGLEPATYGL